MRAVARRPARSAAAGSAAPGAERRGRQSRRPQPPRRWTSFRLRRKKRGRPPSRQGPPRAQSSPASPADARPRYTERMRVRIVGGGLAGSEAAWQAASLGVPVTLHEMRPIRPTAVHKTDRLAELVCSNSFRGDKLDNAVGLLKEEMRRLGSLVMRAAEDSRVPAGAALAVDRERFAALVTAAVADHPSIDVVREEITSLPSSSDEDPVIVATGPLTSDALSAE